MSEIWYIVLNPVSGNGHGLREWERLQPHLEEAGIKYQFGISEYHRHTIELVGSYYALGCRKFLGLGGDGTLNEMVNAIFSLKTASDIPSTIGLVPIGTGNDWVKNFSRKLTADNVAEKMLKSETKFHDVGVIEIPESPKHYFVNVAGAGLDGRVVQELEFNSKKSRKGKWSYFQSLLKALWRFKPTIARGIFPNGTHFEGETLVLTAAKGQFFGNGMHISPKAISDNGLLDITWVKNDAKWRVFPQLPHLFTGKIAQISFVEKYEDSQIQAEFTNSVPVQMDGEWLGETKKLKISLIPNGLCVLT